MTGLMIKEDKMMIWEIKSRKYLDGKPVPYKLKRVTNPWGKGLVWFIVFEDGFEIPSIDAANGRDCFHKNDYKIVEV